MSVRAVIKILDSKRAVELTVEQQRLKRTLNYYDEQPTILIGEQRTNEDGSITATLTIPAEIEAFVSLPENIWKFSMYHPL